jgi:hypothetical protein
MALQIIVVGDLTSHGGRVITGSETHTIGGKRIARLFDLVDCPQSYPDGRHQQDHRGTPDVYDRRRARDRGGQSQRMRLHAYR